VIRIETVGSHRHYHVPAALIEVAVAIFDGAPRDALFSLVRLMTADDLHTTENIAQNRSTEEAIAFARRRLAVPARPSLPF
jgi:hypothetical protein